MAKTKTRDQILAMKDEAVRFVRDVVGDPDRASEIADESVESYAERKGIRFPTRLRDLTGGTVCQKRQEV